MRPLLGAHLGVLSTLTRLSVNPFLTWDSQVPSLVLEYSLNLRWALS